MDEELIKKRFDNLAPFLDERLRRLLAGAEANALGHGGVTVVSTQTGLSRDTVLKGQRELKGGLGILSLKRTRKKGGGRKTAIEKNPDLNRDLERLVEPHTLGDPETPLRWTCKSVRNLADELKEMGHDVSYNLVAKLLRKIGYSLQANRKTRECESHVDRDAQFDFLNQKVIVFQGQGQPVISVDTKKKELVGDFKNGGREWRPKGDPEKVRVHDFQIPELGKVAPYGVYDLTQNIGWVNVGMDHDTAAFAVESIRRWWWTMGREAYPGAKELLITADGGGSNGYRVRLWKIELQKLADETGLCISVSHFPPGTSKWNKIEHRLFSFITLNWRGKPLVSHEVIINLIAATKTQNGLTVRCSLDKNIYPKGIKVTDEELSRVRIRLDSFHGDWNYSIHPHNADVIT